MAFNFNVPVSAGGTTEAQVAQLRNTLFQLTEALRYSLNNLEAENFSERGLQALSAAVGGKPEEGNESGSTGSQYQSLKALVIKTADMIEQNIETLSKELHANYVAQSEFGEYIENARAQFTATADSITQHYNRITELNADLEQVSADFESYKQNTEAYIKTGYLFDELVDGVSRAVYGLAIGEKQTTVIDGEESTTFNNLATFTANKLTFWLGGTEIGYFTGNALYVTGGITLGNWTIDPSYGLSIKYLEE